ncbi:hypothetical protein SAMN04489725_11575 [Alicyclobacillus hesperidum]|uniref:Uncharacterized protein n=1 Tax=Alicyclobacillus hesperidum TaxID=89784 RepID=A0A1H2WK03_9BACL|nr:hypothetical protein SAMN04489725_11575 [Alicyclobacillus hesperidum]
MAKGAQAPSYETSEAFMTSKKQSQEDTCQISHHVMKLDMTGGIGSKLHSVVVHLVKMVFGFQWLRGCWN